jgi:hypothetical protein
VGQGATVHFGEQVARKIGLEIKQLIGHQGYVTTDAHQLQLAQHLLELPRVRKRRLCTHRRPQFGREQREGLGGPCGPKPRQLPLKRRQAARAEKTLQQVCHFEVMMLRAESPRRRDRAGAQPFDRHRAPR